MFVSLTSLEVTLFDLLLLFFAPLSQQRSLTPLYTRGANAFLLFFDVTSSTYAESICDLKEQVKTLLEQSDNKNISVFVCGNKTDLLTPSVISRIRLEATRAFSDVPSCQVFMTSAKDDEEVTELFEAVIAAANSEGPDNSEGPANSEGAANSAGPAINYEEEFCNENVASSPPKGFFRRKKNKH